MFKSLKNKFWRGSKKEGEQLPDFVLIQIFQKALNGSSKEKVLVAEGSGSWLEYIQFDGKVYWTVADERPEWLLVNDAERVDPRMRDFLLPSDSQCRGDIGPLRNSDFEEAEKQKLALEELQRKDKKNRQLCEKARAEAQAAR